mmetsp:Transcript_32996/g.64452  ORF Transcript_32996/g.64452 Transcript_32996/m.64452 type:complete len:231 (-) Transcript_32996:562-1254(-)
MVKHNNTTKSGHFKKSWQKKVKTWFKSPSKKLKRRINRSEEKKRRYAKDLIIKSFRPIVHCPTRIHNLRVKIGRGFSSNEILNSSVPVKICNSIGISIDKRRKNKKKNRFFNEKRLENFFKKIDVKYKKTTTNIETVLKNLKKKEKAGFKVVKKPINIKMEYVYDLNKKNSDNVQSYRIIINPEKTEMESLKKYSFSGSLKYGKWVENKKTEHLFNWSEVENFYKIKDKN